MPRRRGNVALAFLSSSIICMIFGRMQPINVQAASDSRLLPQRFFSELGTPQLAGFALRAETSAQRDTPPEQSSIPEGKGKDLTVRLCTTCHDASRWSGVRHTRDEWSTVIDDMVSKGLQASDDDLAAVNDYLANNLGPGKKEPEPKP